ncbi:MULTISPECIES: hypothetical protein [Kosakonia]|uniref:hypothetical protein n=1 Tax=Kosakonia TaxID=1330547 RepID=UPI000BE5F8E9|nr:MULTISPECIES: hypothetical protein [Kosakonia]PDO86514.1 hypothetical protein BK797_09625 [Kosakonia sacchari]
MLSQSVLLMAAVAPASNGGLSTDKFSQIFLLFPLEGGKSQPHLSGHQPDNRLWPGVIHN